MRTIRQQSIFCKKSNPWYLFGFTFSNSLIIHDETTKEITPVKEKKKTKLVKKNSAAPRFLPCFGQILGSKVHTLSRSNPQIATNPLLTSQQPLVLSGQWITTKPCHCGHACFKLKLLSSSVVHELGLLPTVKFESSYTTICCDPIDTFSFVTHIHGLVLCANICVSV